MPSPIQKTLLATIEVVGKPIPQARPRARVFDGHGSVYDSGTSRPWKALIIDAVACQVANLCGRRLTDPMKVRLEFRFPRINSHFGTGKNVNTLKPNAPTYKAGKPDVDNLIKSTLDAVTETGLWRDDNLVVQLDCVKRYVAVDESPGCTITIWKLED